MSNLHDTMPHWRLPIYWVELRMDDGEVKGFAEDGENQDEAEESARDSAARQGYKVADLDSITLEQPGWFDNDRASELGI